MSTWCYGQHTAETAEAGLTHGSGSGKSCEDGEGDEGEEETHGLALSRECR